MTIRALHILSAVLLLTGTTLAQSGQVAQRINALRSEGVPFPDWSLFTSEERGHADDIIWQDACRSATVARLDRAVTMGFLQERPHQVSLELPFESTSLTLELERTEIFTDDFSVVQASTNGPVAYDMGVHYRGTLRDVPGSLVSFSVFDNEVMGMISTDEGTIVLGKVDGRSDDAHVIYRASDLRRNEPFTCGTTDDGVPYTEDQFRTSTDRTLKCVRLYWEVNYDIFQGKGGVTNATNYVTGLFNQSSTLFANDGITVQLSQVFVWNVASPYTSTSTSTLLNQFGSFRTSFNGDLAHLLGYAGSGGIAWVNGLCSSQARYKMAYSGISSSFQTVPTYSWSVNVVAHEEGHLMGSRHTHACAWNGNSTPIDGCGQAAGYSEGTCAQGPLPTSTVGGTIMSYCHITSSTIKFVNGFGPQPKTLITNNVNNASCLTNCSGTGTCATPGGLAASAVTSVGATLTWVASSGATSYTVQWKAVSAANYISITGLTGTSSGLSGLTAGTAYHFRVNAVCAGGASPASALVTFTTTNAACTDAYEPNGTNGTARAITANTTLNGLIGVAGDVDWFSFSNTAAQPNIRVTLSGLPANYDLRLVRGTTTLANSINTGTTTDVINFNTSTVSSSYKVRVRGVSSSFNTTQCYTLNIQISSSAFGTMGSVAEATGDGVEEDAVLGIHPNPANEQVTITLPAHDGVTNVELLDGLGRVVSSFLAGESTGTAKVSLDVASQPAGIYLMRITQGTESMTQRLMIAR